MNPGSDRAFEIGESLGDRIKQMRLREGLSKARLASKVGVSDVAIGYWESGEITQIGHERLQTLATVLGVTLSELVGDPEWGSRLARARQEGMMQGAAVAMAMLTAGDGVTIEEVLNAFGVRSGDDLTGCAAVDLEVLANANLSIPGLDEALARAKKSEWAGCESS